MKRIIQVATGDGVGGGYYDSRSLVKRIQIYVERQTRARLTAPFFQRLVFGRKVVGTVFLH